jgi:hypothetical protein
MRSKEFIWLGCGLCLCAAVTSPGVAQIASTPAANPEGKRTFPPSFFATYAPVTALDMVNRIPGFSINSGDGRRGFGENAGNVLIDGERPSTKSDDIFTLLSRIPSSQVDYIELNEQAGSSGDARGQGQVVNVVRKVSGKLSGKYEVDLELGERAGVTPYADVSATLRRGVTTYELSGSYFQQFNRSFGPETERDGRGTLINRRQEVSRNLYTDANIAGAIKTRRGGAKINLNGKVRWQRSTDRRIAEIFGAGGTRTATESLVSRSPNSDVSFEVGGDIEFPIANKLKTKVIGLIRREHANDIGLVTTTPTSGATDAFNTVNVNNPSETILRVQNDWSGVRDHAIQLGGELAINRLQARFVATNTASGATTIFPASNVVVSETRFEPFVSDVWTLGPAWKIESGVILESSKLMLTGDSQAHRSFFFAKPRLVATWTADKLTNFEFRAERQVAQLDFNDFATSVDLSAGGQVAAGNADLVPEKTVTFSAQVRRKFLERGSIQLTGSFVMVSDTQDLVPVVVRDAAGNVTSRFDGAGNIGGSRRWGSKLEITLPFDWLTKPLGVAGMELKYTANYNGSRVIDPVTGRARRRSDVSLWDQRFEFRHDIAKSGFSWGFEAYVEAPQIAYFIDQVRTFDAGTEIFAFVEYKKWSAGTLRFQIGNLTDTALTRERVFYRDTRATDDIIRTRFRERSRDTRFMISLNGKF